MFQLETAINNKLKASRITNDSGVAGAFVDDALDNLDTAHGNIQVPGHIYGLRYSTTARGLGVGAGQAVDSTGQYLINLSSGITKYLFNSGGTAYETFVAGNNQGGWSPGNKAWIYQFTGNVASGVNQITNIDVADDARLQDFDYISGSYFPAAYKLVITDNGSGSDGIVATNSAATSTQTGVTYTLEARWFFVFLIGRSSDPNAADVCFDSDQDCANIPAGWDIYRRIGFVMQRHTSGGAYEVQECFSDSLGNSIWDSFWTDYNGDPPSTRGNLSIIPTAPRDNVHLTPVENWTVKLKITVLHTSGAQCHVYLSQITSYYESSPAGVGLVVDSDTPRAQIVIDIPCWNNLLYLWRDSGAGACNVDVQTIGVYDDKQRSAA
jgi:hypothetical protein